MRRLVILTYGTAAYVAFLVTILYAIGFVGDLWVPRSVNRALDATWPRALLIDLLLLGLFAVQHSVMARPAFKQRWTQIVHPAAERSTFVLLSSLLLLLAFWQWRALPQVVWDVTSPVGRGLLWALFVLGWAIVFVSTSIIDHFDLFGLRQVFLHWKQRPYTPPQFQVRLLYRAVRHPLMLGFLIAFWATPTMTAGCLLLAATTTLYILFAIQLEERDLLRTHGTDYAEYRRRTSMILPLAMGWARKDAAGGETG